LIRDGALGRIGEAGPSIHGRVVLIEALQAIPGSLISHRPGRRVFMKRVPESKWVEPVRISLRVALVLALFYVGLHFYSRWTRPPLRRNEPPPIRRVEDFYVHPPKSYVTDIASAQKLVGRPLWVMAGYRWRTEPAGRLLAPLEKIVPTAIERQGDQGVIRFEHEGRAESIAVGPPGRLYIDDMFFIKDPKELYGHWPDATWAKIERHQIEIGMTEFQITFALGAGETKRSSQRGENRIVDYTLCKAADLQPVRVTFRGGRAEEIEALPAGKA
jgi:hypothetical protein